MLALVEVGCCFCSHVERSSKEPCFVGTFVPLQQACLALPDFFVLI